MSELIQVRKKAPLMLPLSVRQELGVEEGDYMDVQVRDGEIGRQRPGLVLDQTLAAG